MGELGNTIYYLQIEFEIKSIWIKLKFLIKQKKIFVPFLDEGDDTTSPLNLPQASSEHDDDESDSDFSDKGTFKF